MYLIFETTKRTIRYAAFTDATEIVYEGTVDVKDWSLRSVQTVFAESILTKLRSHGKVFTKIGVVVPYADRVHALPKPATPANLKGLASTPFLMRYLQPIFSLVQASQKAWPHIPHILLFDTCLSDQIERHMVVPPFSYDAIKAHNIQPVLLHSYGHKANLQKVTLKSPFVSVYLGDHASVAVFKEGKLCDAMVSYSPLSPIMGPNNSGALDVGLLLDLGERKRWQAVSDLLLKQSGLIPMTETHYDIATLLQIAGVVNRSDTAVLDKLSIETIEWIELSVHSFIRSLRQSIGALLVADTEIRNIVINTSMLPESNGLWKAVMRGSLSHLRVGFCDTSLLQAAASDLIEKS